MNRRRIFLPIALVNIAIPFLFVLLNEAVTRIFNPALTETFPERIMHSFRPVIMAIFFSAVILFSLFIYRLLLPLFKAIEGNPDEALYKKARRAFLRLPFVIVLLHTVLWALGTTFFFMINGWKAPWNVPYLWSLLLNTGSGLNGALFSALAGNIVLLPAKRELKMSGIFDGERDSFVRNKYFFIVLAAGSFFTIYAAYMARFFSLQTAGSAYKLNMELSYLLLGAGFLLETMLLLLMANLENSRQVRFMKEKLELLAGGEGDLTSKIHLLHFDEIGELCVAINGLISFLAGLIENVRRSAALTISAGDALSRVTGENESRFGVFRKEIEAIMESIGRQEKELADFRNRETDSSRGLQELVSALGRQCKAMEGFAEALSTILSEQETAVRFSRQIAETAGVLQSQAAENKDAVSELSALTGGLSRSLRKIMEYANSVSEISSRTSLLSLNASIESAHAGAAGKGFAVVAGEVKKHAEASQRITEDIVESIQTFQKQIEEIVRFSGVFRAAFEKNSEKTGEILSRIGQTTGALGHLEEHGVRMRGNLGMLKETSALMDSVSSKQKERTATWETSFSRLSEVIAGTTASASRIAEGLSALSRTQTALAQATKKNQDQAGEMQRIAGRFVTEK